MDSIMLKRNLQKRADDISWEPWYQLRNTYWICRWSKGERLKSALECCIWDDHDKWEQHSERNRSQFNVKLCESVFLRIVTATLQEWERGFIFEVLKAEMDVKKRKKKKIRLSILVWAHIFSTGIMHPGLHIVSFRRDISHLTKEIANM